MALKLGKCRLCLKLGDFFSIFTVDNALQLAEMAMECTKVKIYEGDGLPDKVCSECVQKLSSAYIFKQQCERADQELRRNYVPPPGFSISPPPPNRQSSDSAFSNHTDSSNLTKPPSSIEEKVSPAPRTRKRSIESVGEVSTADSDYRPSISKRIEELRSTHKRPKRDIPQNNSQLDSDFDDNSMSYAGETDSDEPISKNTFACKVCPKRYLTYRSLANHERIHKNNPQATTKAETPQNNTVDALDVEDKLSCSKCDKTFKLKIMLKRHQDVCGKVLLSPAKSPQKELVVSLEPIDAPRPDNHDVGKRIKCKMCDSNFKTMDNLEKHMKICHAAALKRDDLVPNVKVPVPCLFCKQIFEDYYVHNAHFAACSKRDDSKPLECPVCQRVMTRKSSYFTHLKNFHFEAKVAFVKKSLEPALAETPECRMCGKKLATQALLIKHLAEHVTSEGDTENAVDDDGCSTADDNTPVHSVISKPSTIFKCQTCDKEFKYKKSLATHEQKCHSELPGQFEVKIEPPDKASTSYVEGTGDQSDSESSQEEDNTCDICEKQFSYRRLLLHHKKTKHNMSSGTKRAKIYLKDCSVRCLICDLDMKVSAINEHNQKHISMNMKPRNVYTCAECEDTFKSCSALATHIKLIHRLNQKKMENLPNPADFCEVVVTKSEPLDAIQSHNDFGEVPGNQEGKPLIDLSGFTCPICTKKMPTLISLKRHVNWHTNVGNSMEKKYECFVCKEAFRFRCHYKVHMRQHYTDTTLDPTLLTCAICGRRSKHLRAAQAHANFHKQTRFQAKDYQCSICERVFQYRKVYLSHMAVHFKRGDGQNTVVGDIPSAGGGAGGDHACHLCGKACDSESSLKCHLSWHRSKTLLYGARHECPLCKLKFTNKRRLDMHVREHYEDERGPYKCTVCGKGYTDEGYYQRHLKGHNFDKQVHKTRIEKLRKDKVKCPICSRYYPDVVKLIGHLKRTHPESKMIKTDPDAPPPPLFPCKLCARVFVDEKRFKHHEEAHLRKPEFFKCKFCGKKMISLKLFNVHIKGHLTQKYLEEPLQCPQCPSRFVRGYDLHYHLRDDHGVTETWVAERAERVLTGPLADLQCAICLKVLASKGNYERHLDYHNSLRCNYCFDYFSSLRFLEGHLAFSCPKKKLIGETEVYPKKIKCHICYKPFHVQVKLDCHLRTQHEIIINREASVGKKDIVCDYCFKVFENEYALSTHKIYHRTVGYYGCIYCPRKFNTMTLYRKHKNYHFSQLNVDNPTKCEHCDETFVPFRDMIYHMRDVHGDDKEWIVMPKESIQETCKICNKVFFNLHRHLDYHEENRCRKCGEYFFSVPDFDNHLCSIESDDEQPDIPGLETPKYEECPFCFKAFTRAGSKLKHDQIHKGSGSISCRFCPLKFKTMDAFNIHAFSHRSRKYKKKPLKCKICGEKFVKYGPFMKHMKQVHKSKKKIHYRAIVKPETCVVCGDEFPNLHNHYRAHLLNQCSTCRKYFTSYKLFSAHECDKEDADPSKVFTSDANLIELINTYVPKDEKDDEKFYGYTDDEEEEDSNEALEYEGEESQESQESKLVPRSLETPVVSDQEERLMPISIQSPIISDVLSLYKEMNEPSATNGVDDDIVDITDDDPEASEYVPVVILLDDDDD